jgi:serine/threonine-protein kinase
MTELVTGALFAGYRIEAEAGRGGMGVVYRATHLGLDRPVALKLIATDLAGDEGFRARFQREAQLAASIDHPNVLPIYEAGESDGQLFLAMRFVQGTDLKLLINEAGRLDPARAVRIVGQVAAALDAAHARGLVHRDVKPANVMVDGNPDGEHAYLTDFGLTKRMVSDAGLTRTGTFVGTLDYVAPEQIRGEKADARSDVYALACVAYHALAGEPPFERDSQIAKMYAHLNEDPPPLPAGVPPEVEAAVRRGLAKEPDDRQGSAGELARELGAAAAGSSTWPSAPMPPARAMAPPPPPPPAPVAAPPPDDASKPGLSRGARRAVGYALPAILLAVVVVAVLAASGVLSGGDAKKTGAPITTTPTATATGTAAPAVTAATVVKTIEVGRNPDSITVADDGAVWVTNDRDGTLSKIDPKTDAIVGKPLPVGKNPDGVVAAKGVIWTAGTDDRKVRRIQAEPLAVIATVPVGKAPEGLSLGKQLLWVANGGDDTVMRIDRASATRVGGPIGVGDRPGERFVGADSVWVSNTGDGTVSRIDVSTAQVIGAPAKVGKNPRGLAEGLGSVWVANSGDGTVSRLDPKTGKVTGEPIGVGRNPRGVTVGAGSVWVTNSDENTVTRIDAKTGRLMGQPIPVGRTPIGIAFGNGAVWVGNHGDGTVTRIKP